MKYLLWWVFDFNFFNVCTEICNLLPLSTFFLHFNMGSIFPPIFDVFQPLDSTKAFYKTLYLTTSINMIYSTYFCIYFCLNMMISNHISYIEYISTDTCFVLPITHIYIYIYIIYIYTYIHIYTTSFCLPRADSYPFFISSQLCFFSIVW